MLFIVLFVPSWLIFKIASLASEMDDEPKRYWFPAKRYGWGWGPPSTWQGWLVLLVWLAVLIPASTSFAARSLPLFFVFIAVMVTSIIAICYAKGEPPSWRWGDK